MIITLMPNCTNLGIITTFGVHIHINMVSMIARLLQKQIAEKLKPGLVVGLFGARRTGKTVIMEEIQKSITNGKVLMVQGENLDVAEILSSQRLSRLKQLIKGYDYLFIDEAQKIPNIGVNLKLIVDTMPDLTVFVTGSSAFDLKNKIGEPLTGRSKFYYLYPIAQGELDEDYMTAFENLEPRLIYGTYPQVITTESVVEKRDVLESIKNGYLLKDILELDNLKDSIFILNLLKLLAFQIGKDVSLRELATSLSVNKNTVMRYLNLLEKNYIIFSLSGFSRNLRKEISKSSRYFFWDNGIRNAVISNLNLLNSRDDVGKLWENYCISERMKINHYRGRMTNYYFWRTYDQKEIDLIEERDGHIYAFEFKWGQTKVKKPYLFLDTYPNSSFSVINKENFLDFIGR